MKKSTALTAACLSAKLLDGRGRHRVSYQPLMSAMAAVVPLLDFSGVLRVVAVLSSAP